MSKLANLNLSMIEELCNNDMALLMVSTIVNLIPIGSVEYIDKFHSDNPYLKFYDTMDAVARDNHVDFHEISSVIEWCRDNRKLDELTLLINTRMYRRFGVCL
jgi:hypothetical protein